MRRLVSCLMLFVVAAVGLVATGHPKSKRLLRIVAAASGAGGGAKLWIILPKAEGEGEFGSLDDPQSVGPATVRVGRTVSVVPEGTTESFAIAADSRVVQQIEVAGRTMLVTVANGDGVKVFNSSCSGWELYTDRVDPNKAPSSVAYCGVSGDQCRWGFVETGRPRLASDPLCSGEVNLSGNGKRCVRPGMIRFWSKTRNRLSLVASGDAGSRTVALEAGKQTDYIAVGGWGCDFTRLRVLGMTYGLAIGPGEKWTIKLTAHGAVSGVRDGF